MYYDSWCLELIRRLPDAKAPSGFEDEAVTVAREMASPFQELKRIN